LGFSDDLAQNLDNADAVAENIKKTIDGFISNNKIEAPIDPPYQPVWRPTELDGAVDYEKANISAVVWCTGFHSDFNWIEIPVFDGKGYPGHKRGVTEVSGFYFLGLPWLYTWGSARFSGVARDASYLGDRIASKQNVKRASGEDWKIVNEFLLGS
jgi:putative flavoprotein involved in K+ transport